MQIELILLVLSTLFFASILAGKAGSRFGVPALLLFLAVGMLFGSDGLGIHFDNIATAQIIGTVALSAILFSGGLDTKLGDRLMDLRLPDNTLAIMVKRGENFFIPTGKTTLHSGDRLMVLSDDQTAHDKTLQRLGANTQTALEPATKTRRHWYDILFDDSDLN